MFEQAIAIASSMNDIKEPENTPEPENIIDTPKLEDSVNYKKKYSVAELNHLAKRKAKSKMAKMSRIKNRR